METKTVLYVEDVAQMFDAVMESNRKGSVTGVLYYARDGTPLPVDKVEVCCVEKGLDVRSKPEVSTRELGDILNPPVEDPYKVPPPASIGELAAMMDDK